MRMLFTVALAAALGGSSVWGQAVGLPMEPNHDSGQSITAAYEGWYKNPDGTFTILVGYYNRSLKTAADILIGPENRIEPGGPDYGQPTHFLAGRQWGVFNIRVPAGFGDKRLTWTITYNGKTTQIPFSLNPLWIVEPFFDVNGNNGPYVSFKESGPFRNGPLPEAEVLAATVGTPISIPVWVAEDEKLTAGAKRPKTPPVVMGWTKSRGPGEVTFMPARPAAEPMPNSNVPKDAVFQGKATTTATFNAPGDYVLRLEVNDWTGVGGRGFQCCWSTALVKVSVKAAAGK